MTHGVLLIQKIPQRENYLKRMTKKNRKFQEILLDNNRKTLTINTPMCLNYYPVESKEIRVNK